MIVGCYAMDLYCDRQRPKDYGASWQPVPAGRHRDGEFPHTFEGKTYGECQRTARARGWIFHRDGTVSCPRCAEAIRPAPQGGLAR